MPTTPDAAPSQIAIHTCKHENGCKEEATQFFT